MPSGSYRPPGASAAPAQRSSPSSTRILSPFDLVVVGAGSIVQQLHSVSMIPRKALLRPHRRTVIPLAPVTLHALVPFALSRAVPIASSSTTPASAFPPPRHYAIYTRSSGAVHGKGKQKEIDTVCLRPPTVDALSLLRRHTLRTFAPLASQTTIPMSHGVSRRSFHSTSRRDAIPLLPAGIAILKVSRRDLSRHATSRAHLPSPHPSSPPSPPSRACSSPFSPSAHSRRSR